MDNIGWLALKPVEILCQNLFLFIIVDILGENAKCVLQTLLSIIAKICVCLCVCVTNEVWKLRKVKC